MDAHRGRSIFRCRGLLQDHRTNKGYDHQRFVPSSTPSIFINAAYLLHVGGENIFPLEIEERMMQHPAIINASVVGVADAKYGEAVAVFIEPNQDQRLTIEEIRLWVREQLGRHKAPAHVWYLGDKDVGDYFPLTGSGKVKKHLLRDLGNRLLKQRRSKL